ncbi:MAG: hypothetical protein ABIK90_00340 [candidate division WOR-3 bacterium]
MQTYQKDKGIDKNFKRISKLKTTAFGLCPKQFYFKMQIIFNLKINNCPLKADKGGKDAKV